MSSPTKRFRGKHFELPVFAHSVVTKVNPGLREAATDSRAGDFVNRRKGKGSENRPGERFHHLHLNRWPSEKSVVTLPSLRPPAHLDSSRHPKAVEGYRSPRRFALEWGRAEKPALPRQTSGSRAT